MSEAGGSQRAVDPPGARFSEARRVQNLTTADIARRLKLTVWQVEALESGQYQRLPGPIFVRGFIRNYARLLKLDPEELLQAAADSMPQPAPRSETPPSPDIPFPTATTRHWPRFAIASAAIVGLLAIYEFFWAEPEPETVATQPFVEASPPPAPAQSSPKRIGDAQADQPVIAAQPSPRVSREPPAVVPTGAPLQPERTANPDEREVRLVFDEESWVEIRDRNDTVIFYQLNASGTVRRVRGLPPLSVVVGNAHGVRMTYAGQPVDLARHTRIDVARLTLK
jgi:cytoskeleton protein RodZ